MANFSIWAFEYLASSGRRDYVFADAAGQGMEFNNAGMAVSSFNPLTLTLTSSVHNLCVVHNK